MTWFNLPNGLLAAGAWLIMSGLRGALFQSPPLPIGHPLRAYPAYHREVMLRWAFWFMVAGVGLVVASYLERR